MQTLPVMSIQEHFEESQLQDFINSGYPLSLTFQTMAQSTEQRLDLILNNVLERYQKTDEYKTVLYTCLKELVVNGLKANHKRIFFENIRFCLENSDDYEIGMKLYRYHLHNEIKSVFKAEPRDKYVQILLHHEINGIRIEVINNSGITDQEERRLRDKLSKVMQCEDLIQFYMQYADDSEGAGMGMALITTLLRQIGVDPNLFRIITKHNETKARLELPFNSDYQTIRETEKNALGFPKPVL